MGANFEWDVGKALANAKKHGVTFEEAISVYNDARASSYPDLAHDEHEERWITIGRNALGSILVVASTERGSRTRIISARPATKKEILRYVHDE